ncbi:hypothetical protein BASA61_000948 [Batrachochytrium salamandrivorans]|nr:hypothetical protein BASA61_000948 [Batrachochytrium salamandrivorans]
MHRQISTLAPLAPKAPKASMASSQPHTPVLQPLSSMSWLPSRTKRTAADATDAADTAYTAYPADTVDAVQASYQPLSPTTPELTSTMPPVLAFNDGELTGLTGLASVQRPAWIKRSSAHIAAGGRSHHSTTPTATASSSSNSNSHTAATIGNTIGNTPALHHNSSRGDTGTTSEYYSHRYSDTASSIDADSGDGHASNILPDARSWEMHLPTQSESGRHSRTANSHAAAPKLPTLAVLETPPPTHISCVSVSPDGLHVYAGAQDGSIHTWPLQTVIRQEQAAKGLVDDDPLSPSSVRAHSDPNSSHHRVFVGHTKSVTCIQAVGAVLLSSSEDSTVMIWDTADASLIRTIRAHSGGATAVCFTEGLLYSGGQDSIINAWSLKNGRRKWVMSGHTGRISAIAVSPAHPHRLFSSAFDYSIRIWDTGSGRLLRVLDGHQAYVSAIAISRDCIYSGAQDGEIKTWDPYTGDCLGSRIGHGSQAILGLAVANTHLVSCSQDNSISLWDRQSQVLIMSSSKDSTAALTSFAVTADGSLMLGGSLNSHVKVWDLASIAAAASVPTLHGFGDLSSLNGISFPTPPLSPPKRDLHLASWSAVGSSSNLSSQLHSDEGLQIRTNLGSDNHSTSVHRHSSRQGYARSRPRSQAASLTLSSSFGPSGNTASSSHPSEPSQPTLTDQLLRAHEQLSNHDQVKLKLKDELNTLRTFLAQSKSEIFELHRQLESERLAASKLIQTKSALTVCETELQATRTGYDGALSWIFQQVHRQFVSSEIELHSIDRLLNHPYKWLVDDLVDESLLPPPERNWDFDSDWDSDGDTAPTTSWWRKDATQHEPAWSRKAILQPYFSTPADSPSPLSAKSSKRFSFSFDLNQTFVPSSTSSDRGLASSTAVPGSDVMAPSMETSNMHLATLSLDTSHESIIKPDPTCLTPDPHLGMTSSTQSMSQMPAMPVQGKPSHSPSQEWTGSSDSDSRRSERRPCSSQLSEVKKARRSARISLSMNPNSAPLQSDMSDLESSLASVQVKRASVRVSNYHAPSLHSSSWLQPFQSHAAFSDVRSIQGSSMSDISQQSGNEGSLRSDSSTSGIERHMATVHRKRRPKRPTSTTIVKVNTSEVYHFDEANGLATDPSDGEKPVSSDASPASNRVSLDSVSDNVRPQSPRSHHSGLDLITDSTTATEWKKDPRDVQVLEDFFNSESGGDVSDIEYKGTTTCVAKPSAKQRRHTLLGAPTQDVEVYSAHINSRRLTTIPSRKSFQYAPESNPPSDAPDTSPSNRYLPLFATTAKPAAFSVSSRTSTLGRMANNLESVFESTLDNSWNLLPVWLKSGRPSQKEVDSE